MKVPLNSFLQKYLGGAWNLLLLTILIALLICANVRPVENVVSTTILGLFLCASTGISVWLQMEKEDGYGSAILTICCTIILPLFLWSICQSWWINIVGFYLFVGSGFIAAMESKSRRWKATANQA